MPLTLDDLFASPDHYLHSFDGDAARFVPMDRSAYHRSIFLDGRISPAADETMTLPLNLLLDRPAHPAPTAWIFHVAHCGSTLLARALDQPTANLVLREPLALRQTAVAPDPRRLALVRAMIGKRYQASAPTLIKANVPVNFLLPELAATDRQAPTIFLYMGLRDYLTAILRNEGHREWLRAVTQLLGRHIGDLTAADDAGRAATLWLAQIRAFSAALRVMPNARTLDAELFFAEPLMVLQQSARHLGMAVSDAVLEATVAGPMFATYSKNPDLPFDNDARMARRREIETAIADEIATAEAWIAKHCGNCTPDAALAAAALIR